MASIAGGKDAAIGEADGAPYEAKRVRKNRLVKAWAPATNVWGAGYALSMGLLDDAIREHLDLKRRRGADPTEIERAEREALGPVRRSPELSEDDLPHHEVADDLAASDAPEQAEAWEPFDAEAELHDQPRLEHDEELSPDPADAPPTPESESGSPPDPADARRDTETEPGIPPRAANPSAANDLDQETEEYELEPEDDAEDDVLESTPEFLQDAPDHDRLWFEQRPPRDFDFDG